MRDVPWVLVIPQFVPSMIIRLSTKRGPSWMLAVNVVRTYSRRPEQPSAEITELLDKYELSPSRSLNLRQLLSFGHPVTQESVLSSVSYALSELPKRLATRIRSLEALPFIVGTNPYVTKTLNAYRESFQWLATHTPVTNLQENAQFVEKLTALVDRHANDIPTMAKGCVIHFRYLDMTLHQLPYFCSFQECSRYMSPKQISDFLDGAIRNRISVRLIAEQHIAVSQTLDCPDRLHVHVGVVDMNCSPNSMIKMCSSFVSELCEATLGSSPPVVIDGYTDARFA